jgi:hypothetical protein
MSSMVLLAHDPGSVDVTYPVYRWLLDHGSSAQYWCAGPAGALLPGFSTTEEDMLFALEDSIEKKRISVLITGTSWGTSLELKALHIAKNAGVPTVSILDYWSNYADRFKSDQFVYPDHYVMMDELAKTEAVQDGVPEQIIRILGHPGLDRYIDIGRKQLQKDKDNKRTKRVLFLSQPLSALYGDSWGYTEDVVIQQLCRVQEMVEYFRLDIKFHPKDRESLKREFSTLAVEGDLLSLIPSYNLVISMNSMGLLHAVLMGVPGISYQPNLTKPDVSITNKLGLTPLITEFDHLIQYMKQESSYEAMVRKPVLNSYLWSDGNSTERVGVFIQGVEANG